MKNAFNTDIARSIKGSLGRFLAIAGIVALGCGFYAGLRMTSPDMKLASDEYYDATGLMDIRVVSTLGLEESDIDSMAALPGVASVQGAFETDVMTTLNGEQYAMRIHSLPYIAKDSSPISEEEAISAIDSMQNKLILSEGRFPISAGECVISADNVMNSPVSLGDKITIDSGVQDLDDTLNVLQYEVVGFVHSPYYVATTAMGTTTLGSGKINQFMFVPENDFSADLPYTEAFIQVDDAKDEMHGSSSYQSKVDEVIKQLQEIAPVREQARYDSIRADAQKKLDEEKQKLADARLDADEQLKNAASELDEAKAKIETSRAEIASGTYKLNQGRYELEQNRTDAYAKLDEAQAQIDENEEVLTSARKQLDAAKAELDAGWASAGMTPATAPSAIEAMKATLETLDPTDPSQAPQYEALVKSIAQLEALCKFQKEYEDKESDYSKGIKKLDEAKEDLAQARLDAEAKIEQGQAELDAASVELNSGKKQLADGEKQYEDGLLEYEENYDKTYAELEDAEVKIADAQAEIDDLEMPEWLIMDRTKNPGVVSFENDADRVDSIAAFFPLIFFLVAALVALTTMTRMVEEERILIGTYKALGYTKARITSKYLIYAALASILGSVIGIVILSLVLPVIIMEAYAIIYSVPHGALMPIDIPIALSSAGLGVGITLVATWAAVASTLRENPAQLMLPKSPKEGKRILLERIRPLWSRMSFSWKVTFRNLFRYKKRFVMTVIGIAGCTGLLLTGLGLQDSINDIIDKQYGQTVKYDAWVGTDDAFSEDSQMELSELAGNVAFANEDTMIAESDDHSDISVSVITAFDSESFQELWDMRTRIGHEAIELDPDAVVVTEKLATMTGIKVGDEITLAVQDSMGNATSDVYGLKVTGIMENYIANYVFLGTQIYEDTFGDAPSANMMLAEVGNNGNVRDDFRNSAKDIQGVDTVAFNDETIDAYRTMLKSVNMIVVVLVVAAAALAFIVLYNLTNINITERKREIATLKVLGFTPHEVNMYIYREIILLTIIGALVGLVLGIVLEGFVIVSAEVDYVMFGREIHALSFAIAFILTIVFAVFVMFVMRGKLASIDMIESLKSNE